MNPKITFKQLQAHFFWTAIISFPMLPVSAVTFDSGTSGNWNLAATWTLTSGTDADGVPDADDAVTIKAGHNVTTTGGSSCTTITVKSSATLTIQNNLNNSGICLNQGALEWTSGVFDGTGVITNDGTINISGIVTALHNTAADITNNAGGTINWLNGYIDGGSSGQTLTNYGTFNLIGDNPSFRNCEMAIINKSGGSIVKGGTTSAGLSIDLPFTNESGGMVTIHSGASISFNGNFNLTQDGAFTVDGTLNFASGTLSQSQVFSINGTCNVTLGTHTFGAGFSGSGTLVVSGGALTFDAGSTLSTKLTQSNGTLNDNVGLTPGEVNITGGTYQGSGSPTFANGFTWNGGIITGSGAVTVSGNFVSNTGTLSLSGSKELRIASTGTITYNTPRAIAFSSGSSKLTVASPGSLTFDGSSTLNITGGGSTLFAIETGGSLVKTGSGTATILPLVSLAAGSTISIDNGALIFNGFSQTYNFTAGSVSITAPGSFTLANSAVSTFNLSGITISGTGTLITSASTINVNAGTSITSKLTTNSSNFNDNIGLIPGEMTLSGGLYQGTGSATFANGFIWNGGQLNGSGMVTMSGVMTGTSGSRSLSGSKILRITGMGTFTGGGIQLSQTSSLLIASGGSLTIDNAASASISSALTATMEVQTGGSFIKTGAGTLTVSNAPFVNNGTLRVSTGELILGNSTTHAGSFDVVSGATLNFSNTSTNTTFSGINFTNNGTVTVATGRSLLFSGASQQYLHGNGTAIPSLTLNNAQNLNIQGSQNITTFTFTSGKAYLQNGDLAIGTLAGADANKYFVTQGAGRLLQTVPVTATLFPVGPTISSYNPVTLQQVSGTASFGVRVRQGFDYPTNGDGYVNRQWTIDHTGGTPNANLTFQWSPSDATMTFDPNDCHISRYSGGGWNSFGDGTAACGATCIRTQNGVTQFSPFGIGTATALPVELVNFEGLLQDEMVLLTWQTASELNAAWYQIERSADGVNWANIGKVAAQGNTNQAHDYTFTDRSPLPQGYYRLRMEDLDGSFEYSPIVSIQLKTKDFSLKTLYPNPVNTELTLQFFSPAAMEIQLKLTDVSGKIRHTERIHTLAGFFNKNLNVSELEPGIYFIEVSTDEKRSVHRFAKK